jgi:hypothetical protein
MPGVEVLMLVWTIVRVGEGGVGFYSPSVTQTSIIVPASVCEDARRRNWSLMVPDKNTQASVTIACLPLNTENKPKTEVKRK